MPRRSSPPPSIDRRGDHPDRDAGGVVGVAPAIWLAAKAEAVAGPEGKTPPADLQVEPPGDDIAHLLRGPLRRARHSRAGLEGRMDHLELIREVGGEQFLD